MSETISACENICRDLSWIGPFTEWLRNIAIVLGVILGFQQINTWKREKAAEKKAELAISLIGLAHELRDKIQPIRSVQNYTATGEFRHRLNMLSELDAEFKELRRAQVLQSVLIQSAEVNEAIEILFSIRVTLRMSLGALDYWESRERPTEQSQATRIEEMLAETSDDVYADSTSPDPIDEEFGTAIHALEAHLGDYVRYEAR